MKYRTMDNETLHYDVEIGDIWLAADGGSYGHLVVGFHENGSDVIVRPFTGMGFEDKTQLIDGFKLTYRYHKPETYDNWIKLMIAKEFLK